jgi:hypothetical protein
MPTIKFVVDGQDHVVSADRVMRDSQQYVAERREDGEWRGWVRGGADRSLLSCGGSTGRSRGGRPRTCAPQLAWIRSGPTQPRTQLAQAPPPAVR